MAYSDCDTADYRDLFSLAELGRLDSLDAAMDYLFAIPDIQETPAVKDSRAAAKRTQGVFMEFLIHPCAHTAREVVRATDEMLEIVRKVIDQVVSS